MKQGKETPDYKAGWAAAEQGKPMPKIYTDSFKQGYSDQKAQEAHTDRFVGDGSEISIEGGKKDSRFVNKGLDGLDVK